MVIWAEYSAPCKMGDIGGHFIGFLKFLLTNSVRSVRGRLHENDAFINNGGRDDMI